MLFKLEGNHRLPPTNLSPGDMVCVRICDSRGAGATSCMQGFVHNLGEDERSISLALESLQGDTTFSKLFGKNVRIDRIQGLADALTYEVYFLLQFCQVEFLVEAIVIKKSGMLKLKWLGQTDNNL